MSKTSQRRKSIYQQGFNLACKGTNNEYVEKYLKNSKIFRKKTLLRIFLNGYSMGKKTLSKEKIKSVGYNEL